MNRFILIPFFFIVVSCNPSERQENHDIPGHDQLALAARTESMINVHPGVPGNSPFWNAHSQRFIYAPSFEFKESDGADSYRFSLYNKATGDSVVFHQEKPWSSLSVVWDTLSTAFYFLKVEAVADGKITSLSGQREFYRASPYSGPYSPIRSGYKTSAYKLYRYLFNAPYIKYWKKHQKPDPEYGLYGYPAKMFSAVIDGMIYFSESTEDPAEKEEALDIACIVADYMIEISAPEDGYLSSFPPTYTGPIYADILKEYKDESLADRTMLIYPATAGETFLRLYDKTGEQKYLEAAQRIGETYKRIQLENGTWYLLVYIEDGTAVKSNYVVPTGIISFLKKLKTVTGSSEFDVCRTRAELWLKENVVKDFNWEGQFEDQSPADKYKNLSKAQATSYAVSLLEEAGKDSSKIRQAEEIIRFAEDQFVIWEDPIPGDYWGIKSDNWIMPCALEQYNFYTPVNTSSAALINGFSKCFKKTGNVLYLAKAMDLANAIVSVQDTVSGHYPTYLVDNLLDQEGWINCMVYTARTLEEFDRLFSEYRGINE